MPGSMPCSRAPIPQRWRVDVVFALFAVEREEGDIRGLADFKDVIAQHAVVILMPGGLDFFKVRLFFSDENGLILRFAKE